MTDTTAPTVASFVAVDNAPTRASSVDYHITFSESVQDIDLSNFSLTTTGTISGASVTSVTAVPGTDGAEYIISVDTGLGTGTLNVNFNGDGASDLAGNLFAGGALAGPVGYTGYNSPQFITTADLNADGNADLVMINADQNHIATVLLGNGDGTFTAPQEYGGPNAGVSADSVAIGDIDGDGNLDIVIASSRRGDEPSTPFHGEIDVLLGDGSGDFSIAHKISTGFLPNGLTLADVNGDGKLDIIDGDVGPSSSSSNYEASVFLNQSTSGNVSFNSALHYNVNTSPQSTVVADFDGDGIADLAVMNTNSPPTLAIFKGTGQVATPFPTNATYSTSVSGNNTFMIVGDVNGDHHADVVYGINFFDGTSVHGLVQVLLGNNNGTFTTGNTYDVGNVPVGASLVDLNGDGFLDIVTSNYGGNTVSVLTGNGDGTFQTSVSYAAGTQPRGIAVADFNGDGRPDIATATNGAPGAAQIFLDVPAAIPSADTLEVDRTAPALTVGLAHDTGTDGEDLLTNNPTLTGSGDFNTDVTVTFDGVDHTVTTDNNGVWHYVPTELTGGTHTVDVSQTDEVGNTTTVSGFDFDLDLTQPTLTGFDESTAITNANQVQYTLHFSEAVTGLTTGDFSLTTFNTNGAQVVSVDPVDSNDKDYVVTVDTGTTDGALQLVFSGIGVQDTAGNALVGGAFPSAHTITSDNQDYSLVAAGDLNGDGVLDVVAENYIANTMTVLLGNGDGTFTTGTPFASGHDTVLFPNHLVLTDINGDGKLDLLALNSGDDTLSARLGNGDGTFGADNQVATPVGPHSIVVGDFNGDGKIDVIVTGQDNNIEAVSLFAGNGDGTFAAAVDAVAPLGTQPDNILAADFNGDGILDLVTPYPSISGFYVLLGNGSGGKGDGTFTTTHFSTAPNSPSAFAVGDFNGDGHTDIVEGYTGGAGGLLLLRGNGDGTFQAGTTILSDRGINYIDAVDVNGDGILDLVVEDPTTNLTPMVLLGNGSGGKGDGTFGSPTDAGFTNAGSLAYGDFNGDGSIDIVTTSGQQNVRLALGEPAPAGGPTVVVDRTGPAVTISDSLNGHVGAGETDVITFTFSEEVQSFDFANDVKVTGGTLDNFTKVDTTHYTGDFTANVSDTFGGTVSVKPSGLMGSQWLDDAGNIGVSSNTLALTGDTKAPVLTIGLKTDSGASAHDFVTNNVTLTGTADPNAIVHFTLNGNPIAATAKATAAGVWTFTPTSAEGNPQFGAYVVDAAGNQTSTSIGVIYDKTAPTITSITTTESGVVTSGPVHFQLHLSESVAFSMANVSTLKLSDGGIAIFDAAGSDDHTLDYVYTPKANEAVANLKIVSLNATGANVFADGAGNALNITGAANKTISGLSIDTTDSPPVVTKIAASPASTLLHTGDKVTFTITTDEKAFVTGTPVLDLDDGGHAVYIKGSGTNALTFTYTVGAGDTETSALTINDLSVIGGAITDSLGNAIVGSDIHATFANIHLDTTAPTLTHFGQIGDTTTSAPTVSYDIQFSEAVTGVTASDFTLDAGAPAGSKITGVTAIASSYGTEYTVTVSTGTGVGHIDLEFNGATVHDAAGNQFALPSHFQDQTTDAVGGFPELIAVGDFNGDGKTDVVTGNANDNTVSILLGNGDGSFQAQTTAATGATPLSVAIGDLNGDGKADIVVANVTDNDVSILLGNGDGSFQAQTTAAVGTNPESVLLADINGDGKTDIVTANYLGDTVSVLLGNGDGTFQAKLDFATGMRPVSLALGDFNGDGKLDVVTADFLGAAVSILLGNGDGSFQAPADQAVGAGPYSVAVGDLNGDGKLDIVAANHVDNTVSILLGNGDGNFQAQTTAAVDNRPLSVALEDVNGDGKLDIVTANDTDDTASVLLGNGDGTFQAQQTIALGAGPEALVLGDVNGDGRPDIVAANPGDGTVSVVLANPTQFGGAFTITAPTVHHVTVVSDGGVSLGESAIIKLDLGEAVKVTGAPLLDLSENVGTAAYSAKDSDLAHGIVAFKYTATDGDNVNPFSSPFTHLTILDASLNGGTIKDVAGNAADLAGADNTDLGLIVDTIKPMGELQVQQPPSYVGLDSGLYFAPLFQEEQAPPNTDSLVIPSDIFIKWSTGAVTPLSVAGSGNVVVAGKDVVGISIVSIFSKSGDTITDYAGNKLDLSTLIPKTEVTPGHFVSTVFGPNTHYDGIVPTVKSIVATPSAAGNALFTGDTVTFTLNMSENVNAGAGVKLMLSDGSEATLAGAVNGSDMLTFTYTIGAESTADLAVTGLDLTNDDLTDLAGNHVAKPVTLDLHKTVNAYSWKGGAGDFDDVAHWTPAAVPLDGSVAQITAASTVAVTHDHDLGSLLTAKGATVDVNGADLAITHDATNAGTLKLSGQGHTITLGTIHQPFTLNDSGTVSVLAGGGDATLEILGDVTMTGAGRLTLADSGADTASVASNGNNNATLTNGSATVAHTIQGSGTVGDSHLALINAAKGVINANVSGETLSLNPGEGANGGLMEATGGGILSLRSNFNNSIGPTQGTIQALANSTVNLDGVFIENGTFKTTNGAIHVTDASTIQNVTNTGSLVIDAAKSLELDGAVFNNKSPSGVITVNNGAMLELAGAAGALTLQGGGKIVLNGTNAQVISGGTDVSVTNADNLISGFGIIGDEFFTLVNGAKGVVDATGADGLTIDTGTHHVGNAGLIEATAGSTLTIHQTDVDNLATGIISAATTGSHVVLSDSVVTGGIVSVVKGAFLDAARGSDVISGAKVTNAGTIHAGDADLTIIGAVTNTGTLQIDGGAHLNITGAVTGVGTATIGAGTLEFGDASSAKVTFAASVDSTLMLDAATTTAAKFTGTIAGFNAGDDIHLGAISFVADDPTYVHFTENAAHTSAVLTVTDGSQSLTLTFLGDYTHGPSFHLQDDGTAQHHVDLVLA